MDGDTDEALALYERLEDNEEYGIDATWAAIELLEGSGRRSETVARLEDLLEREPIHMAGAIRLARHLLDGGDELARAETLAGRALRVLGELERASQSSRASITACT